MTNATYRDQNKIDNRARLKRFLIAADGAAHGLCADGSTFTDLSAPCSISEMAAMASETLCRPR